MVRLVLLLLLTVSLLSGSEVLARSERPPVATSEAATDSVRCWLASSAIRLPTVEVDPGPFGVLDSFSVR
jgi:hypothetical protein